MRKSSGIGVSIYLPLLYTYKEGTVYGMYLNLNSCTISKCLIGKKNHF